jgi:hypothetical protein
MFSSNGSLVSSVAPDAQFNYVTMLLHGDGTNGAQNNTFLDSSTNAFSITRNGNTTQGSFSPYGSNWSVLGSRLSASSGTAFAFGTGDFTVECFVFLNAQNADETTLFASSLDFSSYTALNLNIADTGTVSLNGNQPTSSTVLVGVWNHVAAVRSSGVSKIYINGVQGSSATNTTNYTSNGCYIGVRFGASQFFGNINGYISNLRVVKGTAVYTSAFTPSTTPLTAVTNTTLLTCQSNRFIDNSSSPLTLTTGNSPSVQRFNPFGASTAYSTSVIGGSGYFDGTGDNLIAVSANTANAMGTGDWTAEAWIYLTVGGLTPFVFDTLPSGSGSATGLRMRLNASNQLQLWQYGTAVLTSSASVTVNAWTHVALVKSSGTTTAYVNGTASNTYSDSGNYICGTNRPMIGSDGFNNGSENSFPGYISNLRLVKGTAVYTASFTPNTAPLTAITNTSLLTNFINAAIFDNAMMNDLETVGNAQISTSVKKYGTGSLAFDGSGDYLYEPITQLLAWGTGNFTLEMWINTSTTSVSGAASRTMWGTASASYQGQLYLEIGTGKVVFGNTGLTFISGTSNVADGNWNHIAISRSGTTCRLFVNGTQEASGTNSVNYDAQPTFIGSFGASDGFFNGYIDDLRITKGYARYTTTFTPPTSALSDTGPY